MVALCFFLLLGIRNQAQENPATLTVICNQKGCPAEMKMSELKSVMMGERQRWSDGTKVVIAMIKTTTPLGEIISRRIYSRSGDAVKGFWASISFQGKYDPPSVFNNVADLESFVAQNPGAIAILDKPGGNEVRAILIDGKKAF
jgi:hypothetical protein